MIRMRYDGNRITWSSSPTDPFKDSTDSYVTMKFETGALLGSSVEDYSALEEKILFSPCSQNKDKIGTLALLIKTWE